MKMINLELQVFYQMKKLPSLQLLLQKMVIGMIGNLLVFISLEKTKAKDNITEDQYKNEE